MHYTKKAISAFNMISAGDRVLLCLSGGKDSHALLSVLRKMQIRFNNKFYLQVLTVDQGQPGWDDTELRAYLEKLGVPYEIINQDTYSIVTSKIPENKTYCSLCSRLRRGIIYTYAKNNNFNKIALGHHRDDLIQTLLMSIFYSGEIKSMPPKLLSDDGQNIVIRPFSYCQEKDIAKYAELMQFPIIPCNLCGSQENLARLRVKRLIRELSKENPKIPSNMLHAISAVRPSQLMDDSLWNFKQLGDNLAEKLEFEHDPEFADDSEYEELGIETDKASACS